MTRKRLNLSEEAKDFIVAALTNKTHSVTALANAYSCHPRSINRVMEERGLAAITSKAKGISDAARVKALLTAAGMSIEQLERLVATAKQHNVTDADRLVAVVTAPALTTENVQRYLDNCTKERLATHFYASGLVKLAEISTKVLSERERTAALFRPGAQSNEAAHATN